MMQSNLYIFKENLKLIFSGIVDQVWSTEIEGLSVNSLLTQSSRKRFSDIIEEEEEEDNTVSLKESENVGLELIESQLFSKDGEKKPVLSNRSKSLDLKQPHREEPDSFDISQEYRENQHGAVNILTKRNQPKQRKRRWFNSKKSIPSNKNSWFKAKKKRRQERLIFSQSAIKNLNKSELVSKRNTVLAISSKRRQEKFSSLFNLISTNSTKPCFLYKNTSQSNNSNTLHKLTKRGPYSRTIKERKTDPQSHTVE